MLKNQCTRGSFLLGPPFYKSRRDKHLSKLLPLFSVSLACCHSFGTISKSFNLNSHYACTSASNLTASDAAEKGSVTNIYQYIN